MSFNEPRYCEYPPSQNYLAEHDVARGMTELIVEPLEIFHVDHSHCERIIGTLRSLNLALQRLSSCSGSANA